jgi:hypothetical protein
MRFVGSPVKTNEKWQAARLLLACWAAVCSWDQGFLAAEAWEQAREDGEKWALEWDLMVILW